MKSDKLCFLKAVIFSAVVVLSGPQTACKRAGREDVGSDQARLRDLDFSPFEDALAEIDPGRLAEITILIRDAELPEIQEKMAAGELNSVELTLCLLDRIRRHDDYLRSYLELNPHALDEAREADRRREEGQISGSLLGIPVSVKDNIATVAPMHTTVGAEILLDHSPAADAMVVRKLREAGAVILGKASLSELAGSLTTEPPGYNSISGMGVNPYGSGLPVSGSSSGSAIATSALLTMVSVGTETSGSLISPASSNGVVAMKPGFGLVSGEGVVPLIRFQDSAGPVARSVKDAALLLTAISEEGKDYAAGLEAGALNGVAVGVLRAGILARDDSGATEFWLARIDEGLDLAGAVRLDLDETFDEKPELLPVIFLGLSEDTVGYLVKAGAPVRTLSELQAYNLAEAGRRIPRGQNMIDLGVRVLSAIGETTGLREGEFAPLYEEATLSVREGAAALLAGVFSENKVDVLISLANTHSDLYASGGYPAITVPLGLNGDGAPNGITLIGKPGEEAKLLAYAYAFEQATHYRAGPEIASEKKRKRKQAYAIFPSLLLPEGECLRRF